MSSAPYSVSGGVIFKDAPEKKYTRRSTMVMNSGKVVELLNLRRLQAISAKADRLLEKQTKDKAIAKLKAKSWRQMEAESLALYESAAAEREGGEVDGEEVHAEDDEQLEQQCSGSTGSQPRHDTTSSEGAAIHNDSSASGCGGGDGARDAGAGSGRSASATGARAAGADERPMDGADDSEQAQSAAMHAELKQAMDAQRRQNRQVVNVRELALAGRQR